MTRLLCEPEDRLGASALISTGSTGSNNMDGIPRRSEFIESTPISTVNSVRGGPAPGSAIVRGLGSDGADKLKSHAWFRGLEWDSK